MYATRSRHALLVAFCAATGAALTIWACHTPPAHRRRRPTSLRWPAGLVP